MSSPSLFIGGRPIRLGKLVGKGGEGEVFMLDGRPNEAVKLYAQPDLRRQQKIEAMVMARVAERSELIAFPLSMVEGPAGKFCGFSMRLVRGHKPLFELYSPGSRKIGFPAADYRFLVRSAANIAIAIAKVHDAGAVVGDINHSGILISDQAVAALIDADSFQFGTSHLCRVGVPEYTPPELQGVKLDSLIRTPLHDAFGLGVVVFQLLFMGRHPFAGRYQAGEMPIEKAIGEHRFAYSLRRNTGMAPPPGTARLTDFPEQIRAMFEAAFGDRPANRPTAAQWATALRQLETSLSACRHNTMHYSPTAAGQCVWCRMERESGIILFVPPLPKGSVAPDPGAAGFDLSTVWKAIEAVQLPSTVAVEPKTTPSSPQPSAEAHKHQQKLARARVSGVAMLIVAAAALGWSGGLWFVYLPLAGLGALLTWGKESDAKPYLDRFSKAQSVYESSVEAWRKRLGGDELTARRGALEKAKSAYQALAGEEKRRLDELQSKHRELQLRRHLESYPVRQARLRGIGAGKLAVLASFGIDTAAQVQRDRILNLPGFGPTNSQPLLSWRANIEKRFVYNPARTAQDRQEEDRVRREMQAKAAKLRQDLSSGAADLRAAAKAVQQRLNAPDPQVQRAHENLEQARVDLEALGLTPPKRAALTPAAVPMPQGRVGSPAMRSFGARGPVPANPTACPRCGGSMVRRTARRGGQAGRQFYGCTRYPTCKGTRPI